jgi:hypothetical protein
VHRPPRDEDERPGRRTDQALAEQEEELSLQDVEQLVATVVNVAGWPGPRGARRLQEPDRARGFLAGRFERDGVRPRYRSALARPEDDAPRSGPPPPCSADSFTGSSPLPLSYVGYLLHSIQPKCLGEVFHEV